MAVPELRDSRRLTGPNILWDRSGAVVDVACDEAGRDHLIGLWKESLWRMLHAVRWFDEDLCTRVFRGGASLALSAPVDALYAATELNEWAFEAARARLAGEPAADFDAAVERLRGAIQQERNPALLALQEAAAQHHVPFLCDDELASIGHGETAQVFPVNELPAPHSIAWSRLRSVPLALVTGTNGKSTTVRMVAAMVRAAGLVAGVTSTDGVHVGGAPVATGDYSGPEGARTVLRHPRVQVAILETARGGMLRRGLGVQRASVAAVTNIAEDHLGEFGVADLDALAHTKLVIRRAVGKDGVLVLNADDAELAARGPALDVPLAWFAHEGSNELVAQQLFTGRPAAWVSKGEILLARGGALEDVVSVAEIPSAMGGAARHNVANALAATLIGVRLGLDVRDIAEGLRAFGREPEDNPGRGHWFELGGVRAVVDFAHNPHGYRAFFAMVEAIEASRRGLVLGQAGDRDEAQIRELTRIAWSSRPDRVFIKEMTRYLRGRPEGEVPAIIEAELRARGAAEAQWERCDSEQEAVRSALRWARPGDLLLLLTHAERDEVLGLLQSLQAAGWAPGDPLPDGS